MTLTLEWALVKKLISLGVPARTVFDGITTREERLAKVREAVKLVPDITYTLTDGKRVTMTQAFMHAYGVAL